MSDNTDTWKNIRQYFERNSYIKTTSIINKAYEKLELKLKKELTKELDFIDKSPTIEAIKENILGVIDNNLEYSFLTKTAFKNILAKNIYQKEIDKEQLFTDLAELILIADIGDCSSRLAFKRTNALAKIPGLEMKLGKNPIYKDLNLPEFSFKQNGFNVKFYQSSVSEDEETFTFEIKGDIPLSKLKEYDLPVNEVLLNFKTKPHSHNQNHNIISTNDKDNSLNNLSIEKCIDNFVSKFLTPKIFDSDMSLNMNCYLTDEEKTQLEKTKQAYVNLVLETYLKSIKEKGKIKILGLNSTFEELHNLKPGFFYIAKIDTFNDSDCYLKFKLNANVNQDFGFEKLDQFFNYKSEDKAEIKQK